MVACMSNNLKSMGLLGMPASCDMGGAIDFSRDFLFHPCLLVRPCQMKNESENLRRTHWGGPTKGRGPGTIPGAPG